MKYLFVVATMLLGIVVSSQDEPLPNYQLRELTAQDFGSSQLSMSDSGCVIWKNRLRIVMLCGIIQYAWSQLMFTNKALAKLRNNEPVFGVMTRSTDPYIIEFMGYQGFDFLILDGEHSGLSPFQCEQLVRAAEVSDVTPLVRVTTNAKHIILRYLDTGAQGVMVPQVNSGAECAAAIDAVKFYPRGSRGLAGSRAANYGQKMNLPDYVGKANNETLTLIQVESKEAVDDIHAILDVPHVDVLFIGRTDLSQSYGFPGQATHPTVMEATNSVIEACHGKGVPSSVLVKSTDEAKEWLDKGCLMIMTTLEAIFGKACKDFVNNV